MKQRINYLLNIAFLIGVATLMNSCSVMIPGGIAKSTAPVDQQAYEVVGDVEETETSTTFLIFQSNKPNKEWIEKTTQKALEKHKADELVNIAWYHTYTNYFLFRTYRFTIQGTAVKRSGINPKIGGTVFSGGNSSFQTIASTPTPKIFNNMGFSLAMSKGSFHEAEIYYSTNNFFLEREENVTIDGFGSMQFSLFMKNRNKSYYFYPQISYAKLSNDGKQKFNFNGNEIEQNFDGAFIRTIPLTFNVGFNGAQMSQLKNRLPVGLNPYANLGLGYYFTEINGGWEWSEFGYNFGLGVEYALQPNLGLSFGFDRHSVIIGKNYSFWDLGLGLNFYMN